jgi:DNA-binding transcriptional LysR family regulator
VAEAHDLDAESIAPGGRFIQRYDFSDMLNKIDLSRADLNLLVLFETVLEERHVARAAERLHLTPSAVSHGLGRLRRWLGDPLFLKTPKGVVPTDRAMQLAAPIAEVLARVRGIVADAGPFDPATSRRRFVLGAPDGASAVLLPMLLAQVHRRAPGLDLALRQLLPEPGETTPARAWRAVWTALESRALELAIVPLPEAPARFVHRVLYEEDFVLVVRTGHALVDDASLARYCEAQHLVVSHTGEARGFVDEALARRSLARRVALTVPDFMYALAAVSGSDLVCAVPRRFAAVHAPRFGLVVLEPPLPLPRFDLSLVVPQAAISDAGIAWLVGVVGEVGASMAAVAGGAAVVKRTRGASRNLWLAAGV